MAIGLFGSCWSDCKVVPKGFFYLTASSLSALIWYCGREVTSKGRSFLFDFSRKVCILRPWYGGCPRSSNPAKEIHYSVLSSMEDDTIMEMMLVNGLYCVRPWCRNPESTDVGFKTSTCIISERPWKSWY